MSPGMGVIAIALGTALALPWQAAAQDAPLVLVHGFKSQGATWAAAETRFNRQLAVTVYNPTVDWQRVFPEQAAQLHAKLPGVPGVPTVVGHSNGGVVAREWSKTKPMKGLLTLSSPNQGAPIANNAIAWGMYNSSIIAGVLNIQSSFSNPNEGSYWIYSVIQGALAFAADTVSTSIAAMSATGFDLYAPVFSQDKVGSPYMQSLNSPANLAREAAAIPESRLDRHLRSRLQPGWGFSRAGAGPRGLLPRRSLGRRRHPGRVGRHHRSVR